MPLRTPRTLRATPCGVFAARLRRPVNKPKADGVSGLRAKTLYLPALRLARARKDPATFVDSRAIVAVRALSIRH